VHLIPRVSQQVFIRHRYQMKIENSRRNHVTIVYFIQIT
jgi:hypothetical protein